MAFTMYAPYIQRHLKQSGYRDAEALKHVKDQTPEALAALERIVRERPVLYSRAPAWHKFSINAGNVKLVDEDAISISPAVTTGLGADFDGDQQIDNVRVMYDASKEELDSVRGKLLCDCTEHEKNLKLFVNFACFC
jgi:DNA-directed RNA polymerase beta' subunit